MGRGLTSIGIRKIVPGQIDYTQIISGSAAGVGSFIAIDADGKPVLATPAGGGGGSTDLTTISGSSATYHIISGSTGNYNLLNSDRITANQISGSTLTYHNVSGAAGTFNLIDADRVTANQITVAGAFGALSLSGSTVTGHTVSGSTGNYNLINVDRITSNQISGSNLDFNHISGTTGTYNLLDVDRISSNQISGSNAIYHRISASTITTNQLVLNRVFSNEVKLTQSFDSHYSESLNTYKDDGVRSDLETHVYFGLSLAMKDSTTVFVGAPEKYLTSSLDGSHLQSDGAVYKFNYTPGSPDADGGHWVQDMNVQLTASDHASMFASGESSFGKSLAVMGTRVAVGAPDGRGAGGTGHSGIEVGKVYIYRESGNSYYKEIDIDVTGSANDRFGAVLSFSNNGTSLAIGSPFSGSNEGKVWMYRSGTIASGWRQEEIIQATDKAAHDYFGFSLSLSSSYLAVGAPNTDSGQGSVYIFNSSSSGWSEVTILTSSHPYAGAYYGTSVQLIDDKTVIVGEPHGWNASASGLTGSVHIEKFRTTGTNRQRLLQVLRNPVSGQDNYYGRNVSAEVSGDLIAVSRPIGTAFLATDSVSAENNRAVLLYETSSTGYILKETLTRNPNIATYYNNQQGKWNDDNINKLTDPWHMLDIKDGTVLHGIPSAHRNNFWSTGSGGDQEGGTLRLGENGEFRAWNKIVTTSGGHVSGTIGQFSELTASTIVGSITKLSTGNDYLRAGTNIILTTGSDGSVTIATTSSAITTTNYLTNGTFQESPNGSRTTFTVASAMVIGTQTIFRGGLYMTPGAGNDYTVTNSTTIEFESGNAPDTGENLRITYIKQ
tara:strand:+ start:17857 stop:20358 length:2502 start_codon:yes stop_codon:yes gene_type:complete